MKTRRTKKRRASQAAARVKVDESFYVDVFQLKAYVSANASELWMSLHGHAESPPPPHDQIANYAEIAFIPNGRPLPDPKWTPHAGGGKDNRISICFHQWQFPIVADILRNSAGVRCYYYEENGKVPEAGIKDWNYRRPVASAPPATPPGGSLFQVST
jgi:hypothetical protein